MDDSPVPDEISQFGFSLMRPLEWIYTGGAGELYTYGALTFLSESLSYSTVYHTQEECLEAALNAIDGEIRLPRNRQSNNERVLAFF